MTDIEKIRAARREYARRYRREHPEKIREAQKRYWLRVAEKTLDKEALQASHGAESERT